jgi:hypothetical protein
LAVRLRPSSRHVDRAMNAVRSPILAVAVVALLGFVLNASWLEHDDRIAADFFRREERAARLELAEAAGERECNVTRSYINGACTCQSP